MCSNKDDETELRGDAGDDGYERYEYNNNIRQSDSLAHDYSERQQWCVFFSTVWKLPGTKNNTA